MTTMAMVDTSSGTSRKAADKRSKKLARSRKTRALSRLQELLLIAALISIGGLMQMLIVLKVVGIGD
jgi:hypothetical protein